MSADEFADNCRFADTPSDMSADEITDNERASRIKAGSWDCECEAWYDREMACSAILRAYMKVVGRTEYTSGFVEHRRKKTLCYMTAYTQ